MILPPYAYLRHHSDLLQLPYFDFLASLGILIPLHPGGFESTSRLVNLLRIRKEDAILEIGCGTGYSTAMLCKSGAHVTVVEKSLRMLASTLFNCSKLAVPRPQIILGEAEQLLEKIGATRYDVALMECVLGFLDGQSALNALRAALSRNGRVGLIDICYKEAPPQHLLSALNNIVGVPIPMRSSAEVLNLFQTSEFRCEFFEESGLQQLADIDFAQVDDALCATGFKSHFPEVNAHFVEQVRNRWQACAEVFQAIRPYQMLITGLWIRA